MVVDSKLLKEYNVPVAVYERVLRCLRRANRCVYLGEISAEIGWNVERTEQVVDALILSGSVRNATDEEKMKIDAPKNANLYVLVIDR